MATYKDREILRSLAARVREIADHPEMPQRRQMWYQHNALRGERPLVLCFPEGAWDELLPPSVLQCTEPQLRSWEWSLRAKILWWEQIHDDNVIEPWFDIGWRVTVGDYGFQVPYTYGENRGSYVWDAPLKDWERDLPKLRFRPLSVDRAGTQRSVELANEIFGDLLPARIHGALWWTVGMTWEAIKLVGLENLMLSMCDQPDKVHRLMSFLRDDHLNFIEWCEREGLLSRNDRADYVGSGGVGYTDELRTAGVSDDVPVKLRDLWGFAESQETVAISPQMFEEFVLQYQIPLLNKFGLNCYGCCENLEHRIDAILRCVPRLRRVSVAPTADQEMMAAKLDGRYIFSRKPYPAHVCIGFNESAIRADLRKTLAIAGGQPLELILKDTHTVEGQPWRLKRWVEIAFEEVDKYMEKN